MSSSFTAGRLELLLGDEGTTDTADLKRACLLGCSTAACCASGLGYAPPGRNPGRLG